MKPYEMRGTRTRIELRAEYSDADERILGGVTLELSVDGYSSGWIDLEDPRDLYPLREAIDKFIQQCGIKPRGEDPELSAP